MPPKKKPPQAPRRAPPETRDKIDVKNRGKGNAIAAGRNALAAVFNINIRDLKWQPVVIVLTIVGGLLGAILWFVIPRSSPIMTGQFNVAVAEFLVLDENGNTVGRDDGKRLAAYVAQQIETQFVGIELGKTVPYEIWGPDHVDPIKGKTVDERKTNAADVAQKIQAQVLIYGVILADGSRSKFMPEFYISHRGFWQASEIGGPHEMGSQLSLTLPFGQSIQAIENPALAGRVNALNLITIGLAYYSVDDYQSASRYFEQASNESRWLESSGKEVAYLLLGNAYIGRASKEDDNQYLPPAEQSYAEALRINPRYGRGLVGIANVLYLEALGSLQDIEIDPAKLEEASAFTEKALALKDQPESANIPAKAHFNLGQIAWARYQAKVPGEDWSERARREFTFVTQEYEEGDKALETYAAHAYFRLGLIEYAQNKSDTSVETAIAWIRKAIALAPPFYKGEYSITLGNIYMNIGQNDMARQAYQEALGIAESNGDANSADKYQEMLEALNQR
jgi:tetratricopeptide (TPR) repeat protein